MKLILAASLFALHAQAALLSWTEWKALNKRSYNPTEEVKRFETFAKNTEMITAHNKRYDAGEETYFLGQTQYVDMSYEEFAEIYLPEDTEDTEKTSYPCTHDFTYTAPVDTTCFGCYQSSTDADETLFLWQDPAYNTMGGNYVTAVKDQASCGSCWAFAGNAVMESQMCMLEYYDCDTWTGISEQNMVDCTYCGNDLVGSYCDHGCSGGNSQNVWNYVVANGNAADSEDGYPYTSGSSGKNGACAYGAQDDVFAPVGASITTTCHAVDQNDEVGLMMAVNSVGPIKVSIYAVTDFHLYSGGVYTSTSCPNTSTNHAVTVTGYGTDCGSGACLDYYMIKNSWGPSWGLGGYIKFRRNYNSMCAVALKAYFPTIA